VRYELNLHHHHQGLDPLIRSVSKVTTYLSNVSSVFQLFSFLVVCSSMISKGLELNLQISFKPVSPKILYSRIHLVARNNHGSTHPCWRKCRGSGWQVSRIKSHNLRSALFCDCTQRNIVVYYRRSGLDYRFLLQGFLKLRPIGCPESQVRNFYSSLRKIPKERRFLWLRGGSLKSRIAELILDSYRYIPVV